MTQKKKLVIVNLSSRTIAAVVTRSRARLA